MHMKSASGRIGLMFFLVVTGFLAWGEVHAAVSCHKINAKGVGQDRGGGVTEAQIIGGGLLHGTTLGSLAITGGTAPDLSFSGTVTFTTKHATLIVTVVGTFNVANGNFIASGPVTAASGKLSGATGSLILEGVQDLATGKFVEDVTGLICVDLAKNS
jgi:hypothetical protein